MEYVTEKYARLKSIIKNSCKGKMIALKMDTATRLERSVLGINIQVIENDKINTYNLAMKELNGKHTAEKLKKEIEKVLKEFEIKKSQIYSVTTDNGRNMLKAVYILSNKNDDEFENNEEEDVASQKCTEVLVENICCEDEKIISIKCAAHTLQLAVKDFLCDIDMEIISRARELVKTLRTPTFRYYFFSLYFIPNSNLVMKHYICYFSCRDSMQILNLNKPRLDVCTR